MADIQIQPLTRSATTQRQLSELLIEAVADGGSVSFMHPLTREDAARFWEDALVAADRGARVVLGAWNEGVLAGTVSLVLDCPPNQPHRAEIAKLMVRRPYQGRGLAKALMHAAEAIALQKNRSLIVLDTAVEGGASSLYEGLGYTLTGVIPDYALKPHGGLTGTKIYWKRLGAPPHSS